MPRTNTPVGRSTRLPLEPAEAIRICRERWRKNLNCHVTAKLDVALWFHAAARITRFMTVDSAQEQAAKELGLPV